MKDPIRDATTAELRAFAARKYTSNMERVYIQAAREELARRRKARAERAQRERETRE